MPLHEPRYSQDIRTTLTPRTCYEPLSVSEYLQEYYWDSLVERRELEMKYEVVTTSPRMVIMPESWQYQYQQKTVVELATIHLMRTMYQKWCRRTPNLVLDMGANDGFYALLASAYGCRVISFEPQNLCMRRLVLAVALNQFFPLVDLRQFVVGTDVKITFNVADGDCNGERQYTSTDFNGTGNLISVGSQRVDDVVCEDHVLLWHIDVEGAEIDVLESGGNKLHRIQHIIVEWFPSRWNSFGKTEESGNSFLRTLEGAGFQVYTMGNYDQVKGLSSLVLIGKPTTLVDGDYLFTKQPDFWVEP
eukprot:TRINITY_DN1217_c0_g1_i2.p1 TRINITY_DN1217_c0_g1~~TRINITY_DN1217_c0_g1_i2.p1  ORF type:complete len:304 (-),score=39.78 TRINITY_DN1217_c0_g1_i2:137-1048(-)